MSRDAFTQSFASVATEAKKVHNLIQVTLQKYSIEGRSDTRAVIESRLKAEWHTHNVSILPGIIREAETLHGAGAVEGLMAAYAELDHKITEAKQDMGVLTRFMIMAGVVRSDLCWRQATEEAAVMSLMLGDNYALYTTEAVQGLGHSFNLLKVLALPMRVMRQTTEAFRLPDVSDEHVTRATQEVLSILDIKAKCEAIIEIVDGTVSDETCLSALQAIDPTWQGLFEVRLWAILQQKAHAIKADRLQALMDGTTYRPVRVPVPVPSGPNVVIDFLTLKDMSQKLRDLQDMCIRGSNAYDETLTLMRRYVAVIRRFEHFWSSDPMRRLRTEPILAGIMHKSFLHVVDPVRFLEDVPYATSVYRAEQGAYFAL